MLCFVTLFTKYIILLVYTVCFFLSFYYAVHQHGKKQKDSVNPGRPKQVNLQKIFTPADDGPVILPQKNSE